MSTQAQVIQRGWALLSAAEKRRALTIVAATVLVEALEAVSLLAILATMGVVVQPELLHSSRVLHALHELAGEPARGRALVIMGTAAVTLRVLRAAAVWALSRATFLFGADCQTRLAHDLFAACMAAPYPWFLKNNTTLLAHLFYEDVMTWGRAFVERLIVVLTSVVTGTIATLIVLLGAPGLGVGALIVIGGMAMGVNRAIRPRLTRLGEARRRALDGTGLAAAHALGGIKDVRLSGSEPYFQALFDTSFRALNDTTAYTGAWHMVSGLAFNLLGQGGFVVIAVGLVIAGYSSAQIATLIAILTLVTSRLMPAVGYLVNALGQIANTLPNIQRLEELKSSLAVQHPAERVGPRTNWDGAWRSIRLASVSFTYPEAVAPAVDDVSFELARGGVYAFVGRSGAGKSTLVDLMLALLVPTQGRVLLDDAPLEALDARVWQSRIGYVPQSPFVTDESLRGNVAFGVPRSQVDDARVREALAMASLAELEAALEQGLDTPLGERGSRLSGGQRQRVSIARALYARPEVLVLDEATSAVDSITETAIQEAIERLRGSVTVLTISHRLSAVRAADRILVLDGGRLADSGTFDELVQRSPLFRELAHGAGDPAPR